MSDLSVLNKLGVEATCSICMEYFYDPVMLKCGHNFCHHCISKYWSEFVSNNVCPQCRVVMDSKILFANKTLEKISGVLKQLSWQAKELARGARVCEKHQKPFASFCNSHQILVCSVCARSTEHGGHDIISVEQAAQEFKSYLCEFFDSLKLKRGTIMAQKLCAENESKDFLKRTDIIKKQIQSTFQELRHFMDSKEYFLTSEIREIEREVIWKREEYMDKLFRDLSSHDKLVREVQEKYRQPVFDLLQGLRTTVERCEKNLTVQCSKPFSIKENWELWDLWDVNIFLESAIKQFQASVKLGLPLQQAVFVLDCKTAHPQLIVSKDCKSVRVGAEYKKMPKNYKRFDTSLVVLGSEEFTEGRKYWDVSIGSEGDWTVGIAQTDGMRKGLVPICPKNGFWAIGKHGNEYIAHDLPNFTILKYSRELKKIRVFFNYTAKQVTFFDADGTHMIHHFTTTGSVERFVPFFHLSEKAVITLTP